MDYAVAVRACVEGVVFVDRVIEVRKWKCGYLPSIVITETST